jgi:hypothetical protein
VSLQHENSGGKLGQVDDVLAQRSSLLGEEKNPAARDLSKGLQLA